VGTVYAVPVVTENDAAHNAEAPMRRRDLAVARSLDSARVRSEGRVQRFLDAGFELLASAESGKEFTVQEVVDRSGQSLRGFYQYFAGKHELLLALFDEAIRSTADGLEELIAKERSPLDRLHRFVIEYFRMCLPVPKGRASKNHPSPVLAEFSHELMTAHDDEATRAFVPLVTLLGKVLADAAAAGVVRRDLEHTEAAGAILATIMFNAAYAPTISGIKRASATRAAEQIWAFVSSGILTDRSV